MSAPNCSRTRLASIASAAFALALVSCNGSAEQSGRSSTDNFAALGTKLFPATWSFADKQASGDYALFHNVSGLRAAPSELHSDAARAVIVFHDATRAAGDDANALVASLRKSPSDPELQTTLIFAPLFPASIGTWPTALHPTTPLVWPTDSYIEGGAATGGSQPSSYVLIDALLSLLNDPNRLPKLQVVTLIGHSAGAQTAQLYTTALGSSMRGTSAPVHFDLATVVANPSSYAYLDALRPIGPNGSFAAAANTSCSGIDAWKFGLTALPAGVLAGTPNALARAYANRCVGYALGLDDNNPADPSMDRGCEAEAQGPTRLARGRSFFGHLRVLFPDTKHTLCEVPGVGHDTAAMLLSACAQNILFRSAP